MINPLFRIYNNNMVFIDVKWWKRQGIIVVQDLITDEFKFYIGLEEMHFTDTEEGDIKGIMNWGSTFPQDAGKLLFPLIDYENDSFKNIYPERLI